MPSTSTFKTEIAKRQALATLVRDYLTELGFDWRAREQLADPHEWVRPPLFTGASISGRPLMPHLALATSKDADDLVDTYERFVGGAIYARRYHHVDIPAWFARECNMRLGPAKMLFVPPAFNAVRARLHLNLVQFAALVAYNNECYIEESPTRFVVTTMREGYRFGVAEGLAVTNVVRRHYMRRTAGLDSATGRLSDLARGDPVLLPVGTMFDSTRAFIAAQSTRIGSDYEGLQLALNLLWWRYEGVYPSRLLDMTFKEASMPALRAAIHEARDYRNYDDPLKALQRIFVPQFLSHGRFRRMFGDPYVERLQPFGERAFAKWDAAINQLDPGTPQET